MTTFLTHHAFTSAEANLLLAALDQHSNCRALAAQIRAKYETDSLAFDAAQVRERIRADRRAKKPLTPRQVEALAAIRAGYTARHRWSDVWQDWFVHGSTKGGATRRMVMDLQAMGFLDDKRNLTPAGAAKLAEREKRFTPRWSKENA